MPDRYAVIGNPISHSKSPLIHSLFAAATGQDMEYTALAAPLDGFAATLDTLRAQGFRGVNVTLPFKLQACAYAGAVAASARTAGAANALKFDGAAVQAENFDGAGLVRDVRVNLGHTLKGQRVLVLGAGGATRGLLAPLLAEQPAQVLIANRTPQSAQALAAEHGGAGLVSACGIADLEGQPFDVVFNATSVSLSGQPLALPDALFSGCTLAYDLVYGKGLTPFLHQAKRCGVPALADGVGMLVEQAAEAFFWWRGVRAPSAPVIARLRVPLNPRNGS